MEAEIKRTGWSLLELAGMLRSREQELIKGQDDSSHPK